MSINSNSVFLRFKLYIHSPLNFALMTTMIEKLFEIYEINGFVVCQPALDYCPKKSKKKPLHGKMIVHGWQITGPLMDCKST